MKILHVGNLANNSYKLAKFQRILGCDAHLELHNYQLSTGDNPAKEDPELLNNFPDWIYVNSKAVEPTFMNRINLFKRGARFIKRTHAGIKKGCTYDVIHAQAGSPIYAQFWSRDKFFSQCTGSDLRDVAFRKSFEGFLLRRAYQKSKCVFFTNIDHWKYLEELNIKNTCFLPNPLDLNYMKNIKADVKYQGYDFVIFHPVRHSWKTPYLDMKSTKGNNKLINGFAKFVKKKRVNALLVLLNSGPDVAASQALIHKLGIQENTKFISRQNKEGLLHHIKACDLVADQFEIGAFGGAALEAMGCGKPLLTYADKTSLTKCYGDHPRIFNAFTDEEIYESLCESIDSPLDSVGEELMRWMSLKHDWEKVSQMVLDVYNC